MTHKSGGMDLEEPDSSGMTAEMEELYRRSKERADGGLPRDTSAEFEAFEAGDATVPGPTMADKRGLKLELRSPSGDVFDPVECFKSPISPSVAVGAVLGKPRRPGRKEEEGDGHQICYGMDVSGLSGRSDGNGNVAEEDSSGFSSIANSESLQPTHRATHSFVPRHGDEIALSQGDPIHVLRECEDHWTMGTNLRTGLSGIFPTVMSFETVFDDEGDDYLGSNLALKLEERDTFYVTYLGSLGVAHHKGNDVLVQSINKVLSMYQKKEELVVPKPVILDISFRGIHMIDKNNRNWFRCPNFDYFYSLQNISFCGSHPKQLRYFGFITKHPLLPRFASHVFLSNVSTQPIVEALGRAFKKSYDEYMAFQHPTEDIYIE